MLGNQTKLFFKDGFWLFSVTKVSIWILELNNNKIIIIIYYCVYAMREEAGPYLNEYVEVRGPLLG